MKEILLIESTYAGPIAYFQLINQASTILIDQHENFVKASYRNRCKIATPDGILTMSVPIKHGREQRRRMMEIEIFNGNDNNWQKQHWQTLCSAYRRSPYFEYYEDELEVYYTQKYDLLMDFNQAIFNWVCEKLDIQPQIELTASYIKETEKEVMDLRTCLNPNPKKEQLPQWIKIPTYHQVFGDRTGFLPNVSIFDLLFAEGPNAVSHL